MGASKHLSMATDGVDVSYRKVLTAVVSENENDYNSWLPILVFFSKKTPNSETQYERRNGARYIMSVAIGRPRYNMSVETGRDTI
jgi:hypothetical protein